MWLTGRGKQPPLASTAIFEKVPTDRNTATEKMTSSARLLFSPRPARLTAADTRSNAPLAVEMWKKHDGHAEH